MFSCIVFLEAICLIYESLPQIFKADMFNINIEVEDEKAKQKRGVGKFGKL